MTRTASLLALALSASLAACGHSACTDTDVTTLVATMQLDDFLRNCGDDGVLSPDECDRICAGYYPSLSSIDACVAGDPVYPGKGDTAGGDTGAMVSVSCSGHYYCW